MEVCEKRDPKGLYQKARTGEINNFTGIDAPYEAPMNAELTLRTESLTIETCVARCLEAITSVTTSHKQPT